MNTKRSIQRLRRKARTLCPVALLPLLMGLSGVVHAGWVLDDAYHWLAGSVENVLGDDGTAQQGADAGETAAVASTTLANAFFGLPEETALQEQQRLHRKFQVDKEKINKAIDTTKELIARSQQRVYLPELYLRLAELYIEKSRIVYFLRKTDPTLDEGDKLSVLEANTLKTMAIEVYARILSHYPEFPRLDKVQFFMAHEFRELDRREDMVAAYEKLIRDFPTSEYVPESLLLLGDYFMADGKLEQARKQYLAVLEYPQSTAIDIARYKLAWVYINRNDYGPAITLLEESVSGARAGQKVDVDTYDRVDIRLEALNDLAFSYSEHFRLDKPEDAVKYFQRFAWSRPAYTQVLEKLANRYLIKKKWQHAAYLYRELALLQHDPEKLLAYAENIYTCVSESHSYEHADRDVAIIVAALEQQRYSAHVESTDRLALSTRYELYAREVSTRLHEQARRTSAAKDFAIAATAYRSYLDFFTDSPVLVAMQANHAEALFAAGRYWEAGKAYEELASSPETRQDATLREKRLYSATLSYHEALKKRNALNYFQATQARSGLQDTGTQYVATFPHSSQAANVLFNVAWIKHDEGKYREAIAGFRDFILRYPHAREVASAVELIMDGYHSLEDYQGLSAFGSEIAAQASMPAAVKSSVATVVKAAESKVISGLIIASVEDWQTGSDKMRNFAEQNKTSALGEQALHALFVAHREKQDLLGIQQVGEDFLSRYPQSASAANLLEAMIETAIRSGQYRSLADHLERYAELYPQHDSSRDFLLQAAQLRETMQQFTQANADYARLLQHTRTDTAQRRQIVSALAANAERLGQTTTAIEVLATNRHAFDAQGQVQVDARLAALYQRSGQFDSARNHASRALSGQRNNPAARNDAALQDALAEVAYLGVASQLEAYLGTRLGASIDNDTVARKTAQLEALQKAYLAVLDYQAPRWSVLACYRLYESHEEYARFLENAPLPDLTEEEAAEYRQLIAEQAQPHHHEAAQYLQSGRELANRLLSFDSEVRRYAGGEPTANGQGAAVSRQPMDTALVGGQAPATEIAAAALLDPELHDLHLRQSRQPADVALQRTLATAYQARGDYAQSIVMVRNILGSASGLRDAEKARLYAQLGQSYLALQDHQQAREALEQALQADPENRDAVALLARLFQHFGYPDAARDLYKAAGAPPPQTLNHGEVSRNGTSRKTRS